MFMILQLNDWIMLIYLFDQSENNPERSKKHSFGPRPHSLFAFNFRETFSSSVDSARRKRASTRLLGERGSLDVHFLRPFAYKVSKVEKIRWSSTSLLWLVMVGWSGCIDWPWLLLVWSLDIDMQPTQHRPRFFSQRAMVGNGMDIHWVCLKILGLHPKSSLIFREKGNKKHYLGKLSNVFFCGLAVCFLLAETAPGCPQFLFYDHGRFSRVQKIGFVHPEKNGFSLLKVVDECCGWKTNHWKVSFVGLCGILFRSVQFALFSQAFASGQTFACSLVRQNQNRHMKTLTHTQINMDHLRSLNTLQVHCKLEAKLEAELLGLRSPAKPPVSWKMKLCGRHFTCSPCNEHSAC